MYKINQFGTIVRDSDGANIPFFRGNRDYEEYLVWVAEGNVAPIEPPPVLPISDTDEALVLLLELATPSRPQDVAKRNELLVKIKGRR